MMPVERRLNMRLSAYLAMVVMGGLCSVSLAQIAGKVTLQGDPPEMPQIKAMQMVAQCAALHKDPVYEDSVVVSDKNEIANVIVFIKPAAGQALKGPQVTKALVLDQKGCMYSPHVLAVEVGQPVMIENSDGFLHNVHALSIDNPAFNFAQVTKGEKPIEPFKVPETFQLKCDVHPWMKAIVRVFDNPYFAVTNETGTYSIDTAGLADGTYTVQAWQEVYHDSEPQQVEVKGGKASKPVDFVFKAKSAKAAATPLKAIHLASVGEPSDCCADSGVLKAN
jgi:plastocyanin